MKIDDFLDVCMIWLTVDAFADALCIALCLACAVIAKNAVNRS